MVERWGVYEIVLTGPSSGNPFTDVEVQAIFSYRNRDVTVDGFYDGGGRYKIRFSPDQEGSWRYRTVSPTTELNGHRGDFEVGPAGAGNHGPVRVFGRSLFRYADGSRHESYGTTCYHWTHTGDLDHEELTLASLAESPFNKVRMCILPTQDMRPDRLAFVGSTAETLDRTRFNLEFFSHLEDRIGDLGRLGVEADLILFHPYDKGHWGVDNMSPELDRFYLRYVVARLAAFRNVWWSISNEYDFNHAKTVADWDDLLLYLQRIDPYRRLASIHNGTRMYEYESIYDFDKPWTTHQSIQHWDAARAEDWRARYPRPVVIDEIGYEGDVDRRWGNLTGREMTRRFWHGMAAGGFVGHGECYVDNPNGHWISRGGRLIGDSPQRIAFLRSIIDEAPADWTDTADYRLIYFGERVPAEHFLELGDEDHLIDVIDTWQMTVEPVPGRHRGRCTVPLGRSDLALRVRRVRRRTDATNKVREVA
ncbi:DUF5060 domain-containing protein [Microlunatus elymi]|uniref:DUF5060 domain-containing protein n=1 Tax=Microlunatus elymi TaxID=2596828 RepID=A0A516Q0Z0_9ACTN|nr:DUF5060 domain-containing protein [Microlunatus elymi]QDP97087.1 DUF5060 domain-containing protein [Microlunatus elymi]